MPRRRPSRDAWVNFLDSRGQLHRVDMDAALLGGTGVLVVPEGTETDTWRLSSVNLRSGPEGVTKVCGASRSSCTEVRDLTAYDVCVRGVTPKYDTPQLASVSVRPRVADRGPTQRPGHGRVDPEGASSGPGRGRGDLHPPCHRSGGARTIMNGVPGTRIIPAGDMPGDGRPDLLSDNKGRLEQSALAGGAR